MSNDNPYSEIATSNITSATPHVNLSDRDGSIDSFFIIYDELSSTVIFNSYKHYRHPGPKAITLVDSQSVTVSELVNINVSSPLMLHLYTDKIIINVINGVSCIIKPEKDIGYDARLIIGTTTDGIKIYRSLGSIRNELVKDTSLWDGKIVARSDFESGFVNVSVSEFIHENL